MFLFINLALSETYNMFTVILFHHPKYFIPACTSLQWSSIKRKIDYFERWYCSTHIPRLSSKTDRWASKVSKSINQQCQQLLGIGHVAWNYVRKGEPISCYSPLLVLKMVFCATFIVNQNSHWKNKTKMWVIFVGTSVAPIVSYHSH